MFWLRIILLGLVLGVASRALVPALQQRGWTGPAR